MWPVFYVRCAAVFTIAAAGAIGTLLLRKLSSSLHRIEEQALSAIVGSACLSTIVLALCSIGLARKGVFLALGMVAIAIAVGLRVRPSGKPFPRLPNVWKWFFGATFVILTIVYVRNATDPELLPGSLTRLLSALDRAHGFQPSAPVGVPEGIDLLFLYAFAFGRHTAAALVNLGLLISLAMLVLSYARRIGHPVAGVVAALLTFASPLIGPELAVANMDVATAAALFAIFYLLQIWDEQRAPALLVPIGILAGFSYAANYCAIVAVPYTLTFLAWKLSRTRQPVVRPLLNFTVPALLFAAPWVILDIRHHLSIQLGWHYAWNPIALPILLTLFGLPSLRFRAGRNLLLAAGVFAILPFSGGAAILPLTPLASLALALGLPRWPGFVTAARSEARTRYPWTAKVPWAAIGIAAVCVWFVLNVNRSVVLRDYFRLEQAWQTRWPAKPGKWNVEDLAPTMWKLGVIRPARVEVEPGISFLLDPRDLIAVSILRGGAWQPEVWNSLSPSLSEGAVFLDVGAHIGYFSMKASPRVGKTGHVLAFEPNPETLVLLRDNVTANHAGNVIVEPIACTEHEQTLTLYAGPPSNTGMSSLAQDNVPVEGAPKSYTVPCRPIDDVVRQLKLTRVDAIKIDVEGAEVGVLRGAMNTLRRFHPKVVVEVVPEQLDKLHTTPGDVIAAFHQAGYNHSRPLDSPITDWEWTVTPSPIR
ncbi:MAG TPA: FkbM family methyltransferase [Bryobacteraceae bacterium]|nr:FkbM family methyltransferase [Bryobacteraceae bacterium]